MGTGEDDLDVATGAARDGDDAGLARVRWALTLAQGGVPAADAGRVDPAVSDAALTWHPSRAEPSVPSGPRARVEANLAAALMQPPEPDLARMAVLGSA